MKEGVSTKYILCSSTASKTTKLILLDSLLQEVEATLPHLVLQKNKNDTEKRSNGDGVREKE
jgi:hypothetical protein